MHLRRQPRAGTGLAVVHRRRPTTAAAAACRPRAVCELACLRRPTLMCALR